MTATAPPPRQRQPLTPASGGPSSRPPPKYVVLLENSFAGFQKTVREVGTSALWRVSTAKHGNGVNQLRDDDDGTYWRSDGAQPHAVTASFRKLQAVTHMAVLLNFAADDSYTPLVVAVRAGTHDGDMADIVTLRLDSPTGWVLIPLSSTEAPVPPRPSPAYAAACAASSRAAAADADGDSDDDENRGPPGSRVAKPPRKRYDPRGAELGVAGLPLENRFSPENADAIAAASPVDALYATVGLLPERFAAPSAPLYVTRLQLRVLENFQNGRDCHVRGVKVFGPLDGPTYTTSVMETGVAWRC